VLLLYLLLYLLLSLDFAKTKTKNSTIKIYEKCSWSMFEMLTYAVVLMRMLQEHDVSYLCNKLYFFKFDTAL